MVISKGARPKVQTARFARMLAARRRKVAKKNLRSVATGFIEKIKELPNIGLACPKYPGLFFKEEKEFAIRIGIKHKSRFLADSIITIRRFNGKLELGIENFQGIQGADKSRYTEFMAENQGIPWNVALVSSIVKTAYESDFDRVLLRDITTTYDYDAPSNLLLTKRSAEDVRVAMKQLYTRTRKACDFTKEEWRGKTRYWVREFP